MLAAFAIVIASACLSACLTGRPQGGETVLAVDPVRTGQGGNDGPLAVVRARVDVQARAVDAFAVDAFVPRDADGAAVGERVLIVILQERGVAVERYYWLATHLASRGYPAIVVDHFADAPLVEIDNGWLGFDAVRRAVRFNGALKNVLPEEGARAIVIGHGEGGRAAQDLWLRYADVAHFIALGSVLAENVAPIVPKDGGEALCIVGSNDDRRPRMQAACTPSLITLIEGGNHALFADFPTAVEQRADGALFGDAAVLRRHALDFLDVWLDAKVRDDDAAKAALVLIDEWIAAPSNEEKRQLVARRFPDLGFGR
ncbi:MAG: hypothetical protein IT381_31215 [Deltaproteobacteria bacterium]|nr:hypothetical protein [Deltaproteobacteria bacterium]